MDARGLAAHLLQFRRQGAKAAEVLAVETSGLRFAVEKSRVNAAEPFASTSLVARVWLDGGRAGVAHGTPEQLDDLLASAATRAARARLDPHAGPVTRQIGTLGGLGIDDRRFSAVSREDREEVLVLAERGARHADRRVEAAAFTYEERRTLRRYASTRGVALEEWDTLYEAAGSVAAEIGGERVSRRETVASRTFSSIASLPFGTSLGRRIGQLMRQADALEGPVRVLLLPVAVAQLFGWIANHLVCTEERRAPFFLRPEGETEGPLVDPRIHLIDDGTLPGGLRTRSFDDRGSLPIPIVLIREGHVTGELVGPELAHAHDGPPTGHVTGDGLSPSNLALRAGGRSINAALSDLGGITLQVDDLGDLEDLDPATGMLDVPIDGGVLKSNRVVGSVRGARLRGDLRAVLGKLVEVCSDTDRIGHVDAPAMIAEGFLLARSDRLSVPRRSREATKVSR
jgi:predicted Zn-dependent protease